VHLTLAELVLTMSTGCFESRSNSVFHSFEVARSVTHRFRLKRHVSTRHQHTADMDPRKFGQTTVVVAMADSELLDQVLSITAVVGVEPLVLSDATLVRRHWSSAAMVVLGLAEAARLLALGLPRRAGVYLVSDEPDTAQAQQVSMQLGAAVVPLPASASWLSDAIAEAGGTGRGTGRLICVAGGSGGVGASTLAAGLAFVATRTHRTMLIDADPRSGGIDLLLGAERTPGWRWPRLANARGHLGDLTGQLPSIDGVEVLSTARGEPPPGWQLQPEQLKAVLLSAMRSHEMAVVDLSRALGPHVAEALRRAELVLLVVRDDVRGVAAGREVARELEAECDHLGLVVRQGRSRLLEPKLVATVVGLPLLGSFEDDPALVLAAERGDPPARSGRSSLARLCRHLIGTLPEMQTADEKAAVSA
jgi:secretion/DNA translocation related CpaE-like protein